MASATHGLFPLSPPTDWERIPTSGGQTVEAVNQLEVPTQVPLFTIEEVARAVGKLPAGKAPGPDLVSNEVIGLTFSRHFCQWRSQGEGQRSHAPPPTMGRVFLLLFLYQLSVRP